MNTALSLRIPSDELALIDRAAAADQRSRTEFMRAASVHAAELVLLTRRNVVLTEDAFDHFLAVMAKPAEAAPAVVKVFARTSPWEASQE